jgi:hydrogenase maturation protein HypF
MGRPASRGGRAAAGPRHGTAPRAATAAGGADPAIREVRAIEVEGVVQGVGFRPFVYRLARELGLTGSVRNAAGRVEIEAIGTRTALDAFELRLRADAPPRARVERVTGRVADAAAVPEALRGWHFEIVESVAAGSVERLFPPDIATCGDCLAELADPADRRYRYPFTNCTNCGPRATIIDELPYDRARTSMREFRLCPECRAEYGDPLDRRFHAEPVACPACGPRLAYRGPGDPAPAHEGEGALRAAAADLLAGRIVAVKGLGGYHLACDATDAAAVQRLRDRKRRWAKPFAVMARDLDAVRRLGTVRAREASLLTSPARPIVLVEAHRGAQAELATAVTNGNRRVGVFLPYTPLHHLLMEAVGRPIVLTSGNLSDEPLVTDDAEALVRLAGLADAFLAHDRQIRARYDDSVTRVVGSGRGARESIIRRGRGYAPDPLPLPVRLSRPVLAVGAELKHTFALASGRRAHVSPHIGDLEDVLTFRAFEENLAHLSRLLAVEPSLVAHDLHPAYLSTQHAARTFAADRRIGVQHHHAHVAACAAEHGITGPFIGVAYDGLGMGDDGTFWGGELLVADLVGYRRVARFGRAPMPGGALAVRRPYRMALGYLFGAEAVGAETQPDAPTTPEGPLARGGRRDGWPSALADPELAAPFLARLDPREVEIVRVQIGRALNAPVASSAGRLFDAVSSLLGLRDIAEFEAQAAIDLEMAAERGPHAPLPYALRRAGGMVVYDPGPTIRAVLEGMAGGGAAGRLAARFQETIATVTRELCAMARADTGLGTVCLSGGVFQNGWLADALLRRLTRDGFEVHISEQVPVNDGGISYGQAAIAAARLDGRRSGVDGRA